MSWFMSILPFSKDLSFPLDAATQTFAFLARRGAGKTYSAIGNPSNKSQELAK